MQLKLEEDPKAWRKFVWTALPAPGVLVTILWWKHRFPVAWLAAWWGVLACVALLAGVRPGWFRVVYRCGHTAAFRLSQGIGWVLLTLLFFLLITPFGWILRLLGHDPLQLRRNPAAPTYWRPVKPANDLNRMF